MRGVRLTGAGADLRVVDLRELSPERWFDIGRPPSDLAAASERTRLELAAASAWALRLVALEGPTVVGRLGGYVSETGALRLWSIRYREDTPEEVRDEAAGRLVRRAVRLASERGDVRLVESRPGHDSPHLRRLLAALEGGGLRQVSQGHVYSARLGTLEVGRLEPPGLELHRGTTVDGPALALYDRVRLGSLDRADAQGLEPPHAVRAELESRAPSRHVWTARFGGQLVGFLWASLNDESRQAWVLDIGVDPELRRRGIGGGLLSSALAALQDAGMQAVLALIDDHNLPSIALHRNAGFSLSEGPFWTYRLVL